jgi:hypothetical protein
MGRDLMLYNPANVITTDFINGSATATTAGIVTIPSGRYFSVSIQLSANVTVAGAATPRVTWTTTSTGATASPATGAIVARLDLAGLAPVTVQSDSTTEFSGYSGNNGGTLDFNIGGASGASCVINGFLL